MPNNGTNAVIGGGGFHHIAIRAFDFEKTLAFYAALGCEKKHGWGSDERANGGKDSRAAMLDVGDGNYIEVFAGREGDPNQEIPEGGLLHFALRSTATDEALERARAAGATVTMEAKHVMPPNSETPHEFWIAFVRGFNGEIIEFFYNDTL
ncbi:MAG: VOC family protein [Armatimonadetes bacterium]|nr:VOC family protein [Armatimonadota bacterium]